MDPRKTIRNRRAVCLLAGSLLLIPLEACSDTADSTASNTPPGVATSATTLATAPGTTPAPTSNMPGNSAGASDTASTPSPDTGIDCSGKSCSLTLSGDERADVFGSTIALGSIDNGRATLAVGDEKVSCTQGEAVSAGPLRLQCTTVTADSVTLSAALG